MKTAAPSLFASVLAVALSVFTSSRAPAGLAEATDLGGTWTSGASAYNGGSNNNNYWNGQSSVTLDGVDAVVGTLGGQVGETTWMQTTVTGPTTLYYSYRVVWPGTAGFLAGSFSLVVGGASILVSPDFGVTGGDTGWRQASAAIPAGEQTVRWQLYYRKGELGVQAYVDQLFTSSDARPRMTNLPAQAATVATLFSWTVPVESSTPATLTATNLPPGLTVDAVTHVISGTPTGAGFFEVTLAALNGSGQFFAKVNIDVAPIPTTLSEALDAPALVFTPGAGWGGVTGLGHDGVDSARASEGTLSTTLIGPGSLSFWYRGDPVTPWGGGMAVWPRIGTSDVPRLLSSTWIRTTLDIPAGSQTVSWTAGLIAAPSDPIAPGPHYAYLDEIVFVPSLAAAEIGVEVQPSNTALADGGSQSFGDVLLGGNTSLTFTIRNTGLATLTGVATAIDGVDASDFTVTAPPTAQVSGPGTTTFTVQFAPASVGPKTAVLHIASNDADENPFDLALAGTANAIVPAITAQPVSQVVDQGASVSFSMDASGTSPSFQWRKDGVDIPGAIGKTLVIASAQPWQIGYYTVRVTNAAGSVFSNTASLGLTDVPSGIWRGLVACYPFDGNAEDICRPGKPAALVSTARLVVDPERGGVAHVQGKGFGVPPFPGEPLAEQGPGGYIRIPRPALGDGEPFTVSLLIKEEGFSIWHGESIVTMGEGGPSVDLLGHYWVGSLEGTQENYGGNNVEVFPYDSNPVMSGWAPAINAAWTSFTVVAENESVRLYRNGQLKGSAPWKKDTVGDFFIGRHWWADGASYSTRLLAKVDDLRIYNRALTTLEVQQLYNPAQATPVQNAFESWAAAYGLSGADAALSADPDHDGISNRDEYPFGTSPVDATAPLMNAFTAGTTLTLQWLEREGVRYRLTESPELVAPWGESLRVPTLATDQSGVPVGFGRMEVGIPVPQPGPPNQQRFFRIEATNGPLLQGGGEVVRQPASGEAVVGQSASFAVAAAGDGLSYQWFKDDQPIPGATSAGYAIAATQLSDTGNYSVLVTNAAGSATSQAVVLVVAEPLPFPGFSYIPRGSFQMGDQSNPLVGTPEERPVHEVFVSGFYMGQTEVSGSQFDEVRTWGATHGYTDLGTGYARFPNLPIYVSSWFEMVKWCNARSEKESLTPCYTVAGAVYRTGNSAPVCDWGANGYRLPTEAEWEKASRGGLTAQDFPWGNTISHSQANYFSSASFSYDISPTRGFHPTYSSYNTSPVGSFAANGYGLYDMAGNVMEWCWDWYENYPSASQADPRGPASGLDRVVRGGSWYYFADFTRVSSRVHNDPSHSFNDYGFRLARGRL